MFGIPFGLAIPLALGFLLLVKGFRIVNEYEAGIVFRLGRFTEVKTPGPKWIIPFVDRMVIVDLRTVARDVPPQDVITRDNVTAKVNAVLYFRVIQADRAVIQVENYLHATSQLAQTTLRSVVGQHDLDELLGEREKVNRILQEIIDRQTEPWGIKVSNVEVKAVDIPPEMQRAIARQAEAERERRAKIIAAQGEMQAAEQLSLAADRIARSPGALQLRYLQTLSEIAVENNSTTIFPLPIDLLTPFLERANGRDRSAPRTHPFDESIHSATDS